MPCKLNHNIICLGPKSLFKRLGTNLKLLTNRNVRFHLTLLLGALFKSGHKNHILIQCAWNIPFINWSMTIQPNLSIVIKMFFTIQLEQKIFNLALGVVNLHKKKLQFFSRLTKCPTMQTHFSYFFHLLNHN